MDLVLGSRFAAIFFVGGVVPNPLDIRFQRVSGLSATIETTTVHEGGQNLYSHRLPKRISSRRRSATASAHFRRADIPKWMRYDVAPWSASNAIPSLGSSVGSRS